jgi:flagellum-specific peptidoglycan hydrolase FlgJ
VVFDPPPPAARFRAYDSLADGLDRYVKLHQRFAGKDADYLPAILAGDTDKVAHILHTMHYYTANESDYKAGMKSSKKTIDKTLGPIAPPAAPPLLPWF